MTARERREASRRETEERLEAGVEPAGLGFYDVAFQERAVVVDARFSDLCGLSPGQQGLEALEFWIEHLHPDDRQSVCVM